jgi:hypothetical protein
MKFETSKIEALQDARRQRENCINDPYFGAMQIELRRISELLFTLYQGQPLIGSQFGDFCELTKEDTPDPKPYEPTEKELWELDKEASEERANNMNAYYEGYTNEQHF